MKQWTPEDAPEMFRDAARRDAASAVGKLCSALKSMHRGHFELMWGDTRYAEHLADSAVNWAKRCRDAKRAVSELRNTLHDFELFCRDLCETDPNYYTLHHAAMDHAGMLSEIDWEDDDHVCF